LDFKGVVATAGVEYCGRWSMRSVEELRLIASIADGLPCGVWVAAAPDGRFVYSNRAFEEIMGMGPVTDVGVGEYAVPYGIYGRDGALYPEHRLPFVRALQARKTVVVDDLVIHRRDGRRVYVRAFGKPIFDEGDELTHVAIAFFDITAEAEAQEARARAEDRLRQVVVHAPVVLSALDRAGVITFVEGRGLEPLGATPADFIGKSAFEVYPEVPSIAAGARRALAGETLSFLAEIGDAAYDLHLAPMRDGAGEIVGASCVATDVTDRHKMQAQLARSERLASLGMLAAAVAHEVNNPLTFVLGSLELLQRDLASASEPTSGGSFAKMEERAREAMGGAERVRAIVADLKVLSRIDEEAVRPVDVGAAIHSSVAMANNEIRHRARLVLDLENVPKVMADEGRLCQVLVNLLINAVHAIPEGRADANEIRVVTRPDPGGVRVEVRDTGEGIAPEVLPRIFEPFFTTKDVGAGTGLGLAISHAVVTALGGRIEVESAPGRGATVRVVLPAASGAVGTSPDGPGDPVPPGRRGRVLVVDDEPLIVKVLDQMIGVEHDVTCETRSEDALARLRGGERFDAIVCDLMMPRLTGMDLYEALLQIAPDQARAMLFVTGGAFTPRASAFLDQLGDAIIDKPVNTPALLARLRRLVG
jgi:two-component system cell cycle sensor histidine kinase/response regulator CckA